MTDPTPKRRNMTNLNQHREHLEEKFGVTDDRQTEINRLRAALSSRDTEIREVLEGLRTGDKCWCEPQRTGPHSPACLAARALYEKVTA